MSVKHREAVETEDLLKKCKTVNTEIRFLRELLKCLVTFSAPWCYSIQALETAFKLICFFPQIYTLDTDHNYGKVILKYSLR